MAKSAPPPDLNTTTNRFYRTGKDHRGGWLVSFGDVKQTFGFKTVRIGHWVSKEEKELSAPLFFDALCDLMDILNAPPILISLRNTLSLDYAIGGQLGVSAHYTPSSQTFSLAKNAGPGSIAHEWFHAFDHYIAAKAFTHVNRQLFASEAWQKNKKLIEHPLNKALENCFYTILSTTETGPNEYVKRAEQADMNGDEQYYSLPIELCARAFEAFIQDSPIKNNFLVSGTQKSSDAKQGLYPTGEHRQKINKAFAIYFSTLGSRLKN